MVFELIRKQTGALGLPKDQIAVSKTSIAFGEEISEVFKESPYVEVYFDRADLKVGFNPTEKKLSSYKVGFNENGNRASLGSSKIAGLIPSGKYKAFTDKRGLIVIDVAEFIDKDKEVQDITLPQV